MASDVLPGRGSSSQPDALQRLDDRPASAFYWRLTLLATLGGFLFGYDTANIGSALAFVPYKVSGFAEGYLVAGASIGAAVGALAAGPLTDRFGRKRMLVIDAGIYAVGALLSALSWHLFVLMAARTLIGLAVGADSAIATAYIAEYAPSGRRGSLSLLQQWMITIGILVSYLVAMAIFGFWGGVAGTVGWRLVLGLGALPALVGLVLRVQMPESPRWLLKKARHEEARAAFATLGIDVTEEELGRTARRLERVERSEQRRSNWTRGVRRALIVVSVFFVFQQITGINVPFYYGPVILGPIFGGKGGTLQQTVAGLEVTAILASVNVVATYWGFRWIDRRGRRPLSMGGYAGMAVFAVVAALGIWLLTGRSMVVCVMIGFAFFIASFAIGVGGTGWLLQGEVFPTAVRGQAAAIAASVDWIANFALIEVFPTWQKAIGLGAVLICFAGLSVLAVVFVFVFLPETKQLSVDGIIDLFEHSATAGAAGRRGSPPQAADRAAPAARTS
jgi:MFS transporter, SP family, arabinose:H+ symporter